MSRATFEQIYSAMFALAAPLLANGTLQTASRRWVPASSVMPENAPALYQVQLSQKAVYTENAPGTVWDINALWVVVVAQGDDTQPMTPTLNPVVDALCQAIAPPAGQRQTLGGLVEYCAIEGEIQITEGQAVNRSVAFIPIRIVVAGF
ncbi:MAG: hypothetical protein ACYCT1_15810 [Steroidobacteraceae bacterium]|jgi:hypothetical protein